ncbi:MAG TPA: 2-oxo acid dehydrogenase subunit E2 [Hellea balneolensis]|uniref:Dihydrolipoamide acetyltransferase component of pyruvate dehydrogenase complex n=1 Tax=Hellea balneolensis TaxID=287478 RepID=A0A7C5R7K5_9PROT|nr:2-oxo acid dehydrogenase subunit E2 [Hellea balneolensis]
MGEYCFKMPDIGEGVTEAEIVEWHIQIGDTVSEDDPVADAMTDKATVELTSPVDGKVISLGCAAGDMLAIGADLVVFQTKGDIKGPKANTPKPEKQTPKKTPDPKPNTKSAPVKKPAQSAPKTPPITVSRPLASPAVRKKALDLGINLDLVTATGKAGQITHEDLEAYQQGSSRGYQKRTGVKEIKITGMRRIISERMSASKRNIPHFSYVEAIDMSEVERTRAFLNRTRGEDQPKLTLIPFFMRAMVKAVRLWPQCNATFDDEAGIVREHQGVHIGMAAQTPSGLMVPVIKHAESLDIWQMAAEIARLGEAAKTGTIAPAELSGSTISLTSLGRLAGVVATPVINRPEVAILCPNKIVETPVVENGQVVVRKMMNFSSSFDHRIVDGFHAAEMIAYIKDVLEHPASLFMD